ncbi:MAG TPA: O-antigen ligase family protein [Solirubrobacteraceae bacterium]|nr:O-antigen ligase family protein [Solirubrobacteraceae bacterium]
MASGPVTAPRPHPAGAAATDPGLSRRRRAALLVPAVLVLGTAVVLALFDGGYTRTVWYPLALFVLALFVLVLVLAPPSRAERSRPFELAVLLLGAFTLWTFASIAWADIPGDAWEGANRTLLYWIAFTLIGLRPWPAWAARAALAIVTLGAGAIAVGLLADTALRADPSALFVEGRIADPFGYANATADFWLIAFFPAVHLAIARDVPWPARGLFLGVAVLLLDTAMLSQSRGAVFAFAAAAVVFVLLHPRHWSALVAVALPVGLVALGWDQLMDVRNAVSGGELDARLEDARAFIAVTALASVAAGAAAAFADKAIRARVQPSARRARLAERGFLGLAGGVAVALLVTLALSGGWIEDRWDDFRTTSYEAVESGDTRLLGSLGSGRYDFYRVALNEFRDAPVGGVGAESFAVPYLQQRRAGESPRYAHSLAFSLLSTLGAVGTLLFAGFVVAALAGFARVRRRSGLPERGLAVGAVGGFAMWFLHAQVDWLWEYPTLALLGLGLLAVAIRVDDRPELPARPSAGGIVSSVPARVAVALVVVAGAVSLALAGGAARFERSAYKIQRTDPDAAISRLDRAADLDRLSADPLIARAVLLRGRGRSGEAVLDLQQAADREPKNWFVHFELGLLAATERRWEDAQRSLGRAAELNPRQELIDQARGEVADRRMVDPAEFERILGSQLSVRLKPFESD